MLDQALLQTMLKLALDTDQISPEEVMAILQRKHNGRAEDKNTETVDSEILDSDVPSGDDQANLEGKILESSFQELEIEDAIQQAKDDRKVGQPQSPSNFATGSSTQGAFQKAASLWDTLRAKLPHKKLQISFK